MFAIFRYRITCLLCAVKNVKFKIYIIQILLIVLHWAQTLSLTLRVVHSLRIFETNFGGVEEDVWD
jgi:hypothetical protein